MNRIFNHNTMDKILLEAMEGVEPVKVVKEKKVKEVPKPKSSKK